MSEISHVPGSIGDEFGAVLRETIADNKRLARDVLAYRAALGYSVPGDFDGKLADGTVPINGLAEATAAMHKLYKQTAVAAIGEAAMFANEDEAAFKAQIKMLERDLETARMQLAACATAALQNTAESIAQRIGPDNPYYSAAYMDVCSAVDREVYLRERTCLWKESENFDECFWDTACGHSFVFIEGGPEENKMTFCPYCGGKAVVQHLEPVKLEEDEDA
jgi:hypothetical protein